MKTEQWIIIGADGLWARFLSNDLVEHKTQRCSINITVFDGKPNNAPCIKIHDNKNPMVFQENGFTAKQINAPQAVFHM